MKKKILTLCLVLILVVTAIGGATLAYFTDTDTKTNVFTTGKVDITLNDQEYVDESDESQGLKDFTQNQRLLPAVAEKNGHVNNAIDKVVSVTNNTGSEEAYVRVHVAMPKSIDDTGLVNVWYDRPTNWNWTSGGRVDYTATIEGVEHNVVCLTYSEKLSAGATTGHVFEWVAMQPYATNEDVAEFGETFNIIVVAEGCQAAGFDNAFAALEASFGTPSATKNPWNNYGAASDASDATGSDS